MSEFARECSTLPFIEDQFINVNDLWRCHISNVKKINQFQIDTRVVTFLRSNNRSRQSMLGTVKWLGSISGIECCGIDLDEAYRNGNSGKLDKKNQFDAQPKHGVYTPLTNVTIVPKCYTASNVPRHLKSCDSIDIRSKVKCVTRSNNSTDKHTGVVVWSGHDEKNQYYYGIKLDSSIPEGTDGTFSYQRLFSCNINCGLLVPVKDVEMYVDSEIITLESTISQEKYRKIVKMLLESDGDVYFVNDANETVFDIARAIGDPSFLHLMLDNCQKEFNLSRIKSMESILNELVEVEKWRLLDKILQRAIVDENSNKYLLVLCVTVLKKRKDFNCFNTIISICQDRNVLLANGETFLTMLFKSGAQTTKMTNVIKMKLFDVDIPNSQKESPLVVACDYLLDDVVKLLISCNCDIKYNNNKAIETAVLAKNKASAEKNQTKEDRGLRIINMLSESNDVKDTSICQICMDNSKSVAFNCGHVICAVCDKKLYLCPFCNSPISNRLKIFL